MYTLILYNKKNKQKYKTIKLDYASNYIKRLKGLMLKEKITPLLYKQPNNNRYLSTIHTLFMKRTIDVIYINTEDQVQEIVTLKPWKIYTPAKNNIKYIIELPENTIKENNITLHTQTKVVKNHEKK